MRSGVAVARLAVAITSGLANLCTKDACGFFDPTGLHAVSMAKVWHTAKALDKLTVPVIARHVPRSIRPASAGAWPAPSASTDGVHLDDGIGADGEHIAFCQRLFDADGHFLAVAHATIGVVEQACDIETRGLPDDQQVPAGHV